MQSSSPHLIAQFAPRLVAWYRSAGRHDLPWQVDASPYRVWISEVMLQQTQVATVIPYFQQFTARFPTAGELAAATSDEVLAHWSGLGYYSRARNLHAAARQMAEHHSGHLPETLEGLMALPGVGRSTAGAILALALGQRHPILDGNVKRVLGRLHCIEEPASSGVGQRVYWSLAERYTPVEEVEAYTQAIMDLGATVCTRSKPQCGRCPFHGDCAARAAGVQPDYPRRPPRRTRGEREVQMLVVLGPEGVLLLQRPPSGVWGGLWAFPECVDQDPAEWLARLYGVQARVERRLPERLHRFTHFDLRYIPTILRCHTQGCAVAEPGLIWYNPDGPRRIGLPKPVTQLLKDLSLLTKE